MAAGFTTKCANSAYHH